LRQHRQTVYERAKALAEGAANSNRSFTESEEADWQKLSGELDGLDERIGTLTHQEQRAADADAPSAPSPGSRPPGRPPCRVPTPTLSGRSGR
jgi:hypothetical protein